MIKKLFSINSKNLNSRFCENIKYIKGMFKSNYAKRKNYTIHLQDNDDDKVIDLMKDSDDELTISELKNNSNILISNK